MNHSHMYFLMVLLGSFLISSCQQESPLEAPQTAEAILTGTDFRLCACCGGYLVTFTGDSSAALQDSYQWPYADVDFDINDTVNFPVAATITYETDTSARCGTLGKITISDLTRH